MWGGKFKIKRQGAMEEKELLVKIVDVAEKIPGYWYSICLRGWPVWRK
jgi:hypothetical protein